jgi:hypothetical protein
MDVEKVPEGVWWELNSFVFLEDGLRVWEDDSILVGRTSYWISSRQLTVPSLSIWTEGSPQRRQTDSFPYVFRSPRPQVALYPVLSASLTTDFPARGYQYKSDTLIPQQIQTTTRVQSHDVDTPSEVLTGVTLKIWPAYPVRDMVYFRFKRWSSPHKMLMNYWRMLLISPCKQFSGTEFISHQMCRYIVLSCMVLI